MNSKIYTFMEHLYAILWRKKGLGSPLEASIRAFYLETLHNNVSNAEDMDIEDLGLVWRTTFYDAETRRYSVIFDPGPSVYEFTNCYGFIFDNIGQNGCDTFIATLGGHLIALSSKSNFIGQETRYRFGSVNDQACKTFQYIALEDTQIRNYVKHAGYFDKIYIIVLDFTDEEIEEAKKAYDSLVNQSSTKE